VYSALVEVHRKFEPAERPPRFVFEVDSRGEFAAPRWQLTFAVESAEAVEGWSQYWSEVSDGLSSTRARHRAHHCVEKRLLDAEPVRLEGSLALQLTKGRRCSPRWCVIRGPLLQFYACEADARQAETDGRVLTHRAGVNRGKGVEAQEATVHLEHAIVSIITSKQDARVWGFEIVSGSKSWQLQTASQEENDIWTATLRSLAGGDSAALDATRGIGHTGAAAGAGPSADVVIVRAEVGQLQLGLNFARCFSERLGSEYFSVQSIRRPDTVAAAVEPQLKLGMVLQSVNGVPFMLTLAESGGRSEVAFGTLQRQLTQRPLTLTFVRTPDRLREDIDAAKAAVGPAHMKPAAIVVAPLHGGNERRLVSGTSVVSASHSSMRSAHIGVADGAGAGVVGRWKRSGHVTRSLAVPTSARRTSIASSVGGRSVGSTSVQSESAAASTGQPRSKQPLPAGISTTPIARAREHYGPWWSRMSNQEQRAAVAAAEQELALVEMGVLDPHKFEFHAGDEKLEADAAEEAARAASIAELVKPSGNPWAVAPAHRAEFQRDMPKQPELPRSTALPVAGDGISQEGVPSLADTPATREYMEGVADARRMSVSRSVTDVSGVPMASLASNATGHAEFLQGVRDAQAQADILARQSPSSPAARWATRQGSAPATTATLGQYGPGLAASGVRRTMAALALTSSGSEYEL
jgi:hypothetical protein